MTRTSRSKEWRELLVTVGKEVLDITMVEDELPRIADRPSEITTIDAKRIGGSELPAL